MKAVAVLMKQLTTSRRKFHERGRDESFDGELEKLRLDHRKLHQDMEDICNRIKCSVHNLLPTLDFDESYKEEIFYSSKELPRPHETCSSFRDFDSSKGYMYSLLIFPEGLVKNSIFKTTDLLAEDVIRTLLKFNLIVGAEWLTLDRKQVTLGGYRLTLERKKVTLLIQLGRWQDSSLHHIEVESQEFLKDLRYLNKLKYLSRRRISRIFKLPSSIVELESLLILDLKACHNLETLPDDISSMKSLTHLIMSDCCLLKGMPKGIEKLINL
ncbi:hypothetical protein V8G54_021813 [Vigna mungo]|uniref:Uncharacterized protein n=1 Tax=Vigna mungo TaxID=3915 RepID=A0AAQ3NGR1_VIGMU